MKPHAMLSRSSTFVGLLAALSVVGCGGEAPVDPCVAGTYDHDDDPATECVAWTDCASGTVETTPETLVVCIPALTRKTHTCVVDATRHVVCWGDNAEAQAKVPGTLGTVLEVDGGGRHTCALDDAGAVTCWGAYVL